MVAVKFITDIKRQVVDEIHNSARRNFKRRKIILKSLNDLFQADLVVLINCFSKYVWVVPVKNKTGSVVSKAMESVLKQQIPNNLQTDAGLEFFNKGGEIDAKYNVNHYNVFSEKKAVTVERVNRTLKNMMWLEFSLQGNYKWLDILPEIVVKYNNKKHRTIGMKPVEVTKNMKNTYEILIIII